MRLSTTATHSTWHHMWVPVHDKLISFYALGGAYRHLVIHRLAKPNHVSIDHRAEYFYLVNP